MFYAGIATVAASGIVAGLWRAPLLHVALAGGVLFAVLLLVCKQHRTVAVAAVFLGALLYGRTLLTLPPEGFHPEHYHQQKVTLTAKVAADPEIKDKSTSVLLQEVAFEDHRPWYGQIAASLDKYAPVEYGDILHLSGEFEAASAQDPGYREYLLNHQRFGVMYYPTFEVKAKDQGNPAIAAIYRFQQAIEQRVMKLFPQNEASLLLGIVLGAPQQLTQTFEGALRATGTTHIIVASGSNASIVIATCLRLTSVFGRQATMILTLAVLVVYAGLAGFNPSILRAELMAGIAMFGQALGRQRSGMQLLIICALGMLLINPLWLLDTSFQLSFAATLGVMLFQQPIESKLSSLPGWLRSTAAPTIAAQLLVYPIVAFTFGEVALTGLVANLAVLWLVPWVMFGGVALVVCTLVVPPLAWLISICLEPALWYITRCITLLAQLPLSHVSVQISAVAAALYYGWLVLLWRRQHASRATTE